MTSEMLKHAYLTERGPGERSDGGTFEISISVEDVTETLALNHADGTINRDRVVEENMNSNTLAEVVTAFGGGSSMLLIYDHEAQQTLTVLTKMLNLLLESNDNRRNDVEETIAEENDEERILLADRVGFTECTNVTEVPNIIEYLHTTFDAFDSKYQDL